MVVFFTILLYFFAYCVKTILPYSFKHEQFKQTIRGDTMKSGYESMIWLNDKKGREFVCYIDDLGKNVKTREDLREEDFKKCLNVNEIIGTERW